MVDGFEEKIESGFGEVLVALGLWVLANECRDAFLDATLGDYEDLAEDGLACDGAAVVFVCPGFDGFFLVLNQRVNVG